MKRNILILSLLMIVSTFAYSQEIMPITDALFTKLDAIADQDVPKGAPGIATGIVMNGELIYEHYAGYANLQDSILIGPKSRFNIASNGKQFTALAVLKLIEENKLNLDEDIRKYFPSLYQTIANPIRIKHLLNHSSGIRDVYDLWSLQGITWWEHTYTNQDALELLQKQNELNFEPGSQYSYSNSNYILLASLVEKVTKNTSFIDYTSTLFKSLNMPNTSFVSDHMNIAGPIAQPYFNFDTWFGYEWIWDIFGDGNIFSTLNDQLEWESILQTKENSNISKSILQKSQFPIQDSNIDNYGYGLEFGEHREIPYTYHGGSTGAWKAISLRFPALNLSIITLTNSGKTDPMNQTLQMVDALLGIDPTVIDFITEPEEIGPYVSIEDVLGIYRFPNGYIMKFIELDGDLYMQRSGRNDIKLIRESDNVFQQWNDAPFKQEFTKNEQGEMQITAYYTTVAPFTLTRIESDFTDFNYQGLEGKYVNEETDVSFSIKHIEGESYEVKIGEQEIKAMLVTPSELLVDDYSLRFSMNKKKGTIDQILMTSGRIQNVKFDRCNQ